MTFAFRNMKVIDVIIESEFDGAEEKRKTHWRALREFCLHLWPM